MTHTDTLGPLVQFNIRGTKFSLFDPGNTVAAETFCELGYEPAVVDLLDQIEARHPKATFFDIGALHGYYSALVGSRYKGWRVAAFEPNPEAYSVLKQNFEALGIKGSAHRQAVNETGGNLFFRGRTIVDPDTPNSIVISGTRFDEIEENAESVTKVVKIDVHGAEGLVLASMGNTLHDEISAIIVEVHAQHLLVGNYNYSNFLEFLETNGLEVFEVEGFRYSNTANLVPLTGEKRDQFTDYTRWTKEEISRERLIFAQRRTKSSD